MMDALLKAALDEAMDPAGYRADFEQHVADGTAPLPPGGGYSADYTKLNLARSRRIEKTLRVLPHVKAALERAPAQTWLVMTEMWCGDSAQNLPVIIALAALAPAIDVRIVRRDTHLELMDRYLTNGTRSIPKLIAFDAAGHACFTWGPRPAAAARLVLDNKTKPEAERLDKDALAEALHKWYATNAGADTQAELAELLGACDR
ncbi:MAG: thioredoxin family protein [Flavobacteriales bacterium]|nr:thioredoxin family protein [Flavobacteriales bacterium]